MKNKGIFFDLYGTLFIFGDMNAAWNDWAEAYYKCVLDFGHNIEEAEFKSSLNSFFSKSEPIISNNGLTTYEHKIKNRCNSVNISCSNEQLRIIADESTAAWQKHIYLDEAVIPLLNRLRKEFKISLVSNFDHPPHIHSLFNILNLTPLFDEIIISGEVGTDKPDPEIFNAALRKTNLAPENVWFVGDSVEDMEGSKAAGLKPVLINRARDEKDKLIIDFNTNPDDLGRIPKVPDKNGVIEIAQLNELIRITNGFKQ